MPPILFLSYSRKNIDEISAIARVLRSHGIRTWQDVDNLGVGLSEPAIVSAIQNDTSSLLFYSTQESVSSAFVTKVELPESERRLRRDDSFKIIPIFRIPIDQTDEALKNVLTIPMSNHNGAKVRHPVNQHAIWAAACRASKIALHGIDLNLYSKAIPLALTSKQRCHGDFLLDLDFSSYFADGNVSEEHWNHMFPEAVSQVKARLLQGSARTIQLTSYAHISLLLLFGYVFRSRTGFRLDIEQSDIEMSRSTCTTAAEPADHPLTIREFPGDIESRNIGVRINLLAADDFSATSFLSASGIACRATLEISPPSFPYMLTNGQGVLLARQLRDKLKEIHGKYNTDTVHLFLAGPLALALFIGYNLNACGSIQCYEYDNGLRNYVPSCLLQ